METTINGKEISIILSEYGKDRKFFYIGGLERKHFDRNKIKQAVKEHIQGMPDVIEAFGNNNSNYIYPIFYFNGEMKVTMTTTSTENDLHP